MPVRHTPAPATSTLSLHDALPIWKASGQRHARAGRGQRGRGQPGEGDRGAEPQVRQPPPGRAFRVRSEEHTSELQSRGHLVCRLLLEKKKTDIMIYA